jgi:hypothetical protein
MSRNFGHHPLSWWNACWIAAPFFLAAYAGGNSWLILRPIRWLTWLNMRDHIEKKFKALDKNPMVYPALIWLNLGDAERAYIVGGMPAFSAAFDAQTGKVKDALINMVKGAGEAKGCGCECGDPACNEQAI